MRIKLSLTGLAFISLSVFAGEPVADFERIVTACQKIHDDSPITTIDYSESLKVWKKRTRLPVKIQYDVVNSNSVVSPMNGFIEMVITTLANDEADEDAAKAAVPKFTNKGTVIQTYKLTYAYRKSANVWELVDGRNNLQLRLADNAPFQITNLPPSGTSAKGIKGPIGYCANLQ
jgi:hypothetical protein